MFCALLTYAVWFEWPAGVQDPTVVDESTGNKLRESIGSQRVIELNRQVHLDNDGYAKIHEKLPLATVWALNGSDIAYFFSCVGQNTMLLWVVIVFVAYAGVHMTA